MTVQGPVKKLQTDGMPHGGGDGLFAQQERVPIRGRPAVRGKRTYGGRPGQRAEEQGTGVSQKHSEAGYGRPVDRGVWTAKTVKRPRQQPAHPQYANYWAPLTRKRHILPHSAQPQHTNYWANAETTPARALAHAKGRTGDRPGPRKGTTTRRNVTQGGGGRALSGAQDDETTKTKPPGPSDGQGSVLAPTPLNLCLRGQKRSKISKNIALKRSCRSENVMRPIKLISGMRNTMM